MSILDFFDEFKTSAVVTRSTDIWVNGVKTGVDTVLVGTFECLYSESAASEAFISERFRDTTTATIMVEYDSDIQKDDTVAVAGKTYKALDPKATPKGIMSSDGQKRVYLAVFG